MTQAKPAPSPKSKKKKDNKDTDLGDEKATVGTVDPTPIDSRPPGHNDKPRRPAV